VEVECLGRGIDDRLAVEPEPGFKGVIEEVDVEVEGPAAAAASSLTIRFLPVSPGELHIGTKEKTNRFVNQVETCWNVTPIACEISNFLSFDGCVFSANLNNKYSVCSLE
jgi:hypothetical protein